MQTVTQVIFKPNIVIFTVNTSALISSGTGIIENVPFVDITKRVGPTMFRQNVKRVP